MGQRNPQVMKSEFRIPPPRCPIISAHVIAVRPVVRRSKRVRRPTIPFEERVQLVPIGPIVELRPLPEIRTKLSVVREVALKKARLQ